MPTVGPEMRVGVRTRVRLAVLAICLLATCDDAQPKIVHGDHALDASPPLTLVPFERPILQSIAEQRPDPRSLLNPEVQSAGTGELIGEDATNYARARWSVRGGRFDRALKLLDGFTSDLFADRIALTRGQVLTAFSRHEEAKAAFFEAVYRAQNPNVAEAAMRGLASVSGKLGHWSEQLMYLDALVEKPRERPDHSLALERATVLARLRLTDQAADAAWAVLDAYPDPNTAERAGRLVLEFQHRRRFTREESARADIARAKWLARSGRVLAAIGSLEQIKKRSSRTVAPSIELQIADLHRARGAHSRAEQILVRLTQRRDLPEVRAQALLRLGRLAFHRHQFKNARQIYEDLARDHADTEAAKLGEFESAELEYYARDYFYASEKMLSLAEAHPKDELAPKALWMGGWSAYLAGSSTAAISAFSRLLSAEDPDMREAAQYWIARAYERDGKSEHAIDGYLHLLEDSPLAYYGLLARSRLDALGVSTPIATVSPPPAPPSVDDAIALLGPDRPVTIDRAIALFRAKLTSEAVEELLAAADEYRRLRHDVGMSVVVDLFRIFERDSWVFLLARRLAENGADRDPDEPDVWRLWRYAYPRPFPEEVEKAARQNGADPLFVYSIMRTESLFRPDAVSAVGARGLMQIMPATARWIAQSNPRARPHSRRFGAPEANIWLGTWYLKYLLDRYAGNLVYAIGSYNAGPGAVDRWLRSHGKQLDVDEFVERTPFEETRRYIRRALESYMVYHALYAPSGTLLVSRAQEPTPDMITF
jgi:soluble lytic murein transglycosylase-like protein